MTSQYATQLLDDFEIRDDLATVSLYNAVTGVTTAGVKAINRGLNYKEITLGAPLGLQATDQVWILGCKSLGSVTPEPQHVIITAAGERWTILTADGQSFQDTPTTWTCTARKQP